jgi:hyperosmotically inducible periplasmic protein
MNGTSLAIAVVFLVSSEAAQSWTQRDMPPANLSQFAPLSVSRVSTFGENLIEHGVHCGLVKLPYFGVFDHLAYSVEGDTVILFGQVVNPNLKADAADVVWTIEGVNRVINRIRFLPHSPADNRIRLAVFSAIYSHPSIRHYAFVGAGGAIHIVVEGGAVSLEGEVSSDAVARLAVERTQTVPGVAAVANHLTIGR